MWYDMIWYTIIWFNIIRCNINIIWYDMIWYDMMIWCHIIRFFLSYRLFSTLIKSFHLFLHFFFLFIFTQFLPLFVCINLFFLLGGIAKKFIPTPRNVFELPFFGESEDFWVELKEITVKNDTSLRFVLIYFSILL